MCRVRMPATVHQIATVACMAEGCWSQLVGEANTTREARKNDATRVTDISVDLHRAQLDHSYVLLHLTTSAWLLPTSLLLSLSHYPNRRGRKRQHRPRRGPHLNPLPFPHHSSRCLARHYPGPPHRPTTPSLVSLPSESTFSQCRRRSSSCTWSRRACLRFPSSRSPCPQRRRQPTSPASAQLRSRQSLPGGRLRS